MQHATYTCNMQHIHTTCNIYIQPATALPTSLWNSAMSSAPFRCDAAAYVACCMLSVSGAQALDTQLEQRGSGAGSAAEALHVLERVASLENELTRCEQQVHHRALCAESIDNGSASFMPHTPMQKGIQKTRDILQGKVSYRNCGRSTAVIDDDSVCSLVLRRPH